MGLIIIFLLAAVEIFFAVYAFIRRKSVAEEKAVANIAELLLFILLSLTGIIDWSFRYYFLAATLFILAAIGAVTLIKRKKKQFSGVRVIAKAIGKTVLILVTCASAVIFPQYSPLTVSDAYTVQKKSYVWTDESRKETFSQNGENRSLTVDVYCPEQEGSFPLIVFSHGAFGYSNTNYSLYQRLASDGYVVASINHPYHAFFDSTAYGEPVIVDEQFMNEAFAVQNGDECENEFELTSAWLKLRVADGNFVIDTIKRLAKEGTDPLLSKVDTDKIGVMGHSLGGAMAAQLGRERDDIGAVIVLDGTLLGERLSYENGIEVINPEPYPIPMLDLYNSSHYESHTMNRDTYVNTALADNSKDVTELVIAGTTHMDFTDLPLFSPFLAGLLDEMGGSDNASTVNHRECTERINEICLEYFNCKLKGGETPVYDEEI